MASRFQGVGTILSNEVEAIRSIIGGLTDSDLIAPSACDGWRIADLVVHLRFGAESILAGLASSTDAPPDRDFISYWRDWPAHGAPSFSDVRYIWASSAAYRTGDGLRKHFDDVAATAARAARAARAGNVRSQGHVLGLADFLATLGRRIRSPPLGPHRLPTRSCRSRDRSARAHGRNL